MLVKKIVLALIVFLVYSSACLSQTKLNRSTARRPDGPFTNDSASVKKSKSYKSVATIDMYRQFNRENDSAVVDTTLSISKFYKFNYLQKDNFGLMPFANIGQTYNSLSFNSHQNISTPLFGSRARHFNYMEHKDINFYEVPTPWTRLTYKTAFQQGQLLDAFFTVNLSRQFNFSIAYKGLRSLGNYQNVRSSTGNFRFTTNYYTKNKKYKARAYIVTQDLSNLENGGLKDEDVVNFTSGNEEFLDRAIFDPNFDDAENLLLGKRFFFNHSYDIISKKDSLSKNQLRLTHSITFEDKYYEYVQTEAAQDFFGDAFTTSIKDKATLEDFNTEVQAEYENDILGNLNFGLNYTDLNYGYNRIVIFPNETIPNRIKEGFLGISAGYAKRIKNFNLNVKAGLNLSDSFKGNYFSGEIGFDQFDNFKISAQFNLSSRLPNYNFLLYQSDYINYNWYNFNTYENSNTQQLVFNLRSKKFFDAVVDITNIDNYTYFNLDETVNDVKVIRPEQYNSALQYLRVKISRELKLGKFALDNTVMYQNVISETDVLNVPTFITRNTLYYSDHIFKKAMLLQTGVTLNYFTKYNMNGYDPLLAEFYTQNETELGGFPRLDFFINAKVRQTRIFLIAEHFNSSMTGYNYFSAPNNPYRDFTIRFGLVWDFFL